MNNVEVKIYPDDVENIPFYANPGDAGMDVRSIADVVIEPYQTKMVPTGLRVKIPDGYEIQVRPRSGMSLKTPLRVSNAPGTVDSSYTGEINVLLTNYGVTEQYIKRGDRIAQLVLCPVMKCVWELVFDEESLGTTERGSGGFGSTGQ